MPSEEASFEEFWKIYPKKVAKGDARKAWLQTEKIRPSLPELLKTVYAARASKAWLKDAGEFIPHPATWLRQERWEDQHDVDLGQMYSKAGKVCAYCGAPSTGEVGGRHACDAHFQDAMEGKKSNVIKIGTRPDDVVDKKLESAGS